MAGARAGLTGALLPKGRGLVGGGGSGADESTALASAELYDPTTSAWSPTGSMVNPRSRHTATLLGDGRVLVAGGYCPSTTTGCPETRDPDGAIAEAEIYDPATGKWSTT